MATKEKKFLPLRQTTAQGNKISNEQENKETRYHANKKARTQQIKRTRKQGNDAAESSPLQSLPLKLAAKSDLKIR